VLLSGFIQFFNVSIRFSKSLSRAASYPGDYSKSEEEPPLPKSPVWPDYLSYYLSKYPEMYLDNDFCRIYKNEKISDNSDGLTTIEIGRIENEISAKKNNGY